MGDKVETSVVHVRDVRVESEDIGFSVGRLCSENGLHWHVDGGVRKALGRAPFGLLEDVEASLQEALDGIGGAMALADRMIRMDGGSG